MQWRELERAIGAVWGCPLPDDDCGRSLLRLIVEYLPYAGRIQIVTTAARWAPWLGAAELALVEMDAATNPPRKRTADEIAREIGAGLTYEVRQRLGLKTIGAADVDRAGRQQLRRERKAEQERARRARRRIERSLADLETKTAAPAFERSERQEALRAALLSRDWVAISDLCETVGKWPVFRGVSGPSLRTVIRREIAAMANDGLVTVRKVAGRGGAVKEATAVILTDKLAEDKSRPTETSGNNRPWTVGNTTETNDRGQ